MDCPPSEKFAWKGVFLTSSLIGLVAPALEVAIGGRFGFPGLLRATLAGLVFSNCIGLLATGTGYLTWPVIRSLERPVKWLAIFSILLFAGIAGTLAACVILTALGVFPAQGFWDRYLITLRFALFITFTFGAGAWAFETLRAQLQQMSEGMRTAALELKTQQLERERLEKLATEAGLSSLESRIHPHFLFNALNSISALVREDPALAERLIERMAALLRFSLDSARMRLVPLGLEIKIVEDYLEIEKVRFGDRLRYEIDIPEAMKAANVPPMSVQSLVENSVKYAISPKREGGSVAVRGSTRYGIIQLDVWDDGPGFALDTAPEGHGLENLRSRLSALYGDEASLTVTRMPDGTTVTITLPGYRKADVA